MRTPIPASDRARPAARPPSATQVAICLASVDDGSRTTDEVEPQATRCPARYVMSLTLPSMGRRARCANNWSEVAEVARLLRDALKRRSASHQDLKNVRVRAAAIPTIARITRVSRVARISRMPDVPEVAHVPVDDLVVVQLTNVGTAEAVDMASTQLADRLTSQHVNVPPPNESDRLTRGGVNVLSHDGNSTAFERRNPI